MQYDPRLNLMILGNGQVFQPGPQHTVWQLLSRKSDAQAMLSEMVGVTPTMTGSLVDSAISRGVSVASNDPSVSLWDIVGTIPDPAGTPQAPLPPFQVNESAGQLAGRQTAPMPFIDDLTKFNAHEPLALKYNVEYGIAQFYWG